MHLLCAIGIAAAAFALTTWTPASAAIGPFNVSPTSGPPGTVVNVSGSGCSPGLTVSPSQDYVSISSTSLPLNSQIPVAANGSWSGSFTIPQNTLPLPAVIAAACFTNGLPSLLTIYTPQTFTVTAAPTTTTTPPTTPATSPPTTSPATPSNPPATTATTTPSGAAPSNPSKPDDTEPGNPGSGQPPNGDGSDSGNGSNGGDGADGARGADGSTATKTSGSDDSDAATRGSSTRAANLDDPQLSADFRRSSGNSPAWLWWLLLLAIAAIAVATWYWLHRHRTTAIGPAGDEPVDSEDS
jgi:hypothetical protein